jgi:LAO/AO transport system kinase
VQTIATDGRGVNELWSAIQRHSAWSHDSGEFERRRSLRLDQELRRVVNALMAAKVEELSGGDAWQRARREVAARRIDPWTAANELLA